MTLWGKLAIFVSLGATGFSASQHRTPLLAPIKRATPPRYTTAEKPNTQAADAIPQNAPNEKEQ
ncbi:MAG: hypothetical protein H9917_00120 [Candidatus Oceanisphaera merdipullorum]|nr:hypothetical protein [Candidatus Oceanisphaera merdipullorum]